MQPKGDTKMNRPTKIMYNSYTKLHSL